MAVSRANERRSRGVDDGPLEAFLDSLWWCGDLFFELGWAAARAAVVVVEMVAEL